MENKLELGYYWVKKELYSEFEPACFDGIDFCLTSECGDFSKEYFYEIGSKILSHEETLHNSLKEKIEYCKLLGEFQGTLQGLLWHDLPEITKQKMQQKLAQLQDLSNSILK